MSEMLILVDELDNPVGFEEKLSVHQAGKLHRAFSVFIFSKENRLLLQQRPADKYHSANLWTNTCCSHPRIDEKTIEAASRRLEEEMGLKHISLKHAGYFIYQAAVGQGLIEHEYDHVFVGLVEKEIANIHPDPTEVAAWEWKDLTALEHELKTIPQKYTAWFEKAYGIAKAKLSSVFFSY